MFTMELRPKSRLALVLALAVCLGAIIVAGCAPRQTEPSTSEAAGDSAGATIATAAWSPDSDCTVCHEASVASQTMQQALASNPEHANSSCMTCHSDAEGLTRAHRDATTPLSGHKTKLHYSEVPSEPCLSCHVTLPELAALTANSTVLTDADGRVANPHDMPVNDNHATVTCGSCHVMHRETNLAEDARKLCISCHHEEVYVSCSSCHEDMASLNK